MVHEEISLKLLSDIIYGHLIALVRHKPKCALRVIPNSKSKFLQNFKNISF